ncbi:hypothetical protein KQX54_011628, partial [Cotesia glomerata]
KRSKSRDRSVDGFSSHRYRYPVPPLSKYFIIFLFSTHCTSNYLNSSFSFKSMSQPGKED